MIDITELLDEQACYDFLLGMLPIVACPTQAALALPSATPPTDLSGLAMTTVMVGAKCMSTRWRASGQASAIVCVPSAEQLLDTLNLAEIDFQIGILYTAASIAGRSQVAGESK